MEVFFRALEPEEIADIALGAATRAGYAMERAEAETVGRYASCGRDAVNIVQMCAGLAQLEDRTNITREDVQWVVQSGHYAVRPPQSADTSACVGAIHGLAVYGAHQGAVMEIEAVSLPGSGEVTVTALWKRKKWVRKAGACAASPLPGASAENVRTLLREIGFDLGQRDLHINFPGGAPVDGPSAGVAMAVVAVSALTGQPVDGHGGPAPEKSPYRGGSRPWVAYLPRWKPRAGPG